jgi:hypothetical protein
MKLRATMGAIALATAAFVVQPASAQAGDLGHVRKHVHDAVHRVGSVILCPLEWFRHRHHHAAAAPAPKKVAAKKMAAKKMAAAPLK